MAFFNPAFLWFAMAGAIPVIIHLLHRQKYRRVPWAAMEWLLAALKKTQRRLRIENLILLLIRILIMILLALAISRPFVKEAGGFLPTESNTAYLIVIDNSYSMGYKKGQASSFDTAKKKAGDLLGQIKASDEDKFRILLMSEYPERLAMEWDRVEKARGGLTDIALSHYGSNMLRTLQEVQETLQNVVKNPDRRIYIFTDLQRNGWVPRDEAEARKFKDLLKSVSTAERTKLTLVDVGVPEAVNHAIIDLRLTNRIVTTKRPAEVAVDLFNFSATPMPEMRVSLHVDGNFYQEEITVLPPGTPMTVTFRYDFAEAGPHLFKASIGADFLELDDTRYLAVDVKNAVKGLLIDGEPGPSRFRNETGTLVLAMDPWADGQSGIATETRTWDSFSVDRLDLYDFLVLANVKAVAPEKVESIEEWVRRGGGLFITLGDQVQMRPYNDLFFRNGEGLSPASLVEVLGQHPDFQPPGAPRRIQWYDGQHPVFRTLRQYPAAVGELVFYNYVKVDRHAPETVRAYLDDGDKGPLVLEKKFGEGKVVLWTSSIDDEWNDGLPGKPPYPILVYEIGEYLASRPFSRRNFMIGDPIQITLPVEQWQQNFILDTPLEGAVTLFQKPLKKDMKVFSLQYPTGGRSVDVKELSNEGLRHAGEYKLSKHEADTGKNLVAWFACNLPPRQPAPEELAFSEGNLERIGPEQIRTLYPDFKVEFAGEKEGVSPQGAGTPPASNLWRQVLYMLVGFLMVETALAWLFGRSKQ